MEGTPFRHQGRVPGVGIDCIGMLVVAMHHFELMPLDFDIRGYPRMPNPDKMYTLLLEQEYAGFVTSKPKAERLPGDFALFRIAGQPQHFAWITDYGMLHAQFSLDKKRSCVVEHVLDQRLIKAISKVWQVKGIE